MFCKDTAVCCSDSGREIEDRFPVFCFAAAEPTSTFCSGCTTLFTCEKSQMFYWTETNNNQLSVDACAAEWRTESVWINKNVSAFTLTVDSRRLRTHTPSAKVSGLKWKVLLISPSHTIISLCWDEEMSAPWDQSRRQVSEQHLDWRAQGLRSVFLCLTWMQPFLKTGTFQRRASRTRAASSSPTSRRLSAAPGFFMSSGEAQARLHPGHTHLGRRGGQSDKQNYTFRSLSVTIATILHMH